MSTNAKYRQVDLLVKIVIYDTLVLHCMLEEIVEILFLHGTTEQLERINVG
jgi:hypothetical protein